MNINNAFGLFWSVLVLFLSVFAILKIVQSYETTGMKVLWILIILILPVLGLVIWFFVGPGDKSFKI